MRASVIARLMFTLALALCAVSGFQFFFVGDQVRRDLIAKDAREHAVDAWTIEQRAEEAAGLTESPFSEVSEVTTAIASHPDVVDAVVVDRSGVVFSGSRAGQVGTMLPDSGLRKAAHSGRTHRGVLSADGHRYSYVNPLKISGQDYALVVQDEAGALADDVGAFRTDIGWFVLLSLLVALPLFYLLGGRRVAALYTSALQRARRDGLTDLDNHRAFQDELERALGDSHRHGTDMTLALIDIDDFKFENDRHGHQHGDRILCELAAILQDSRDGDRAFRLGGDEFAVLLTRTSDAEAEVPLQRICTEVRARLGGVSASIGFSCATPEDRESTTLWGRSDAALLEAKRRGGDVVVAAADVLDGVPVVTIEKVRAVRSLIETGTPQVAFQPIWDLGGSRVLGYEALARFNVPELNGPGEAFEVADSIGRGHELDAVCRRATLNAAGLLPEDVLLFLNVSPQTLEHDGLAGDSLVQAVRGAGLEPARVVLEITERTEARMEVLRTEVDRLRALGFRLALDDVGAGNAGLEMLRSLPVEFVKIDRGVVAAAVDDRNARAVLLGIMAFARELDVFVIAEGIETETMLELARDPEPARKNVTLGAHGAQGYLLGRPGPAPSAQPSYEDTLDALTQLTADRERRRVTAALQGSDALYGTLVRTLPDTIVVLFDRELRFQLVEGAALGTIGWSSVELVGRTVAEAFPAEHAENLSQHLRPCLAGHSSSFHLAAVRTGDEMLIHAAPVTDERAGVIGVMLVLRVAAAEPEGGRRARQALPVRMT